MIIKLTERDKWVTVVKQTVEDDRLSWGARGLHTYLMSKPPDWRVRERQLVDAARTGRTRVRGYLRELEACGYIVRTQGHRDDGTFDSSEVLVFEIPQVSTVDGKSVDGAPADGGTVDGESTTTKEGPVLMNEGTDLSPDGAENNQPPPSKQEETAVWNAVARMWGLLDPVAVLPDQHREISKASRQLRDAGRGADEVFERGQRIMRLKGWEHLTPHALTSNWHLGADVDPYAEREIKYLESDADRSHQAQRERDALKRRTAWASDHAGEPIPPIREFLDECSLPGVPA